MKSLWLLAVFFVLWSFVGADITGTDPPAGTCLCFTENSVNIRDSPCGTVIGLVSSGQCFTGGGQKQTCTLNGISYEFFLFNYGGQDGWSAGNYMDTASDTACQQSDEGYTCDIRDQNMRIHETTSSTPYDCVDGNCGNTCQGGQCVAYVTCRCTRNGQHAPNTGCWSPGTRVMLSDGRCNRNIPINTAIATFNAGGSYYAGHAAVFVGCSDDYTIRTYDQWCCRSIGYSSYPSSHSYYSNFYVITNNNCADRPSWPCRLEAAGPTCCPTSVAGCLAQQTWWEHGDNYVN